MRTYDEIIARIEERRKEDVFGTEISDLLLRLPFDLAKKYLKDPDPEKWTILPCNREGVLSEMFDYMPFAWEKANDKRALSAARSMSHYMAWTWLIGDDFGDLTDYEYYGKDNLVRICEFYGWDSSQWDDGIREND